MGLDASACYQVGQNQAKMPNVEALCAAGMVFENTYAAPVCSPTRATILTGKYGFRTDVGAAMRPKSRAGLSGEEVSLFDVLKPAGYASAVIGKWHVAGLGDTLDHPSTLGVENYYGIFEGGLPDYFNWTAVENGKEIEVTTYSTTDFTNRAVYWISEQENPWFLWLAYNAPRVPFHLPPADLHSAQIWWMMRQRSGKIRNHITTQC